MQMLEQLVASANVDTSQSGWERRLGAAMLAVRAGDESAYARRRAKEG